MIFMHPLSKQLWEWACLFSSLVDAKEQIQIPPLLQEATYEGSEGWPTLIGQCWDLVSDHCSKNHWFGDGGYFWKTLSFLKIVDIHASVYDITHSHSYRGTNKWPRAVLVWEDDGIWVNCGYWDGRSSGWDARGIPWVRSTGKQPSLVKQLPFSFSVQTELSGCNSWCTFFLEKLNLIKIVWICLLQWLLTRLWWHIACNRIARRKDRVGVRINNVKNTTETRLGY